MKSLFTILLVILFSCKKQDIEPCIFIQTEKVTAYPLGSDLFYENNSVPVEERYIKEYCNISKKELEDLLDLLNSHIDSADICIQYHSVVIKKSTK